MKKYTKKQAYKLYKRGDLKGAYAVYRELLSSHPEDAHIMVMLAWLEIEVNNNFHRAEHFIKEAKRFGCVDDDYHRLYGKILFEKEQFTDAIVEYKKAVSYDRSVENLTTLGFCLNQTNCEHAIPIFNEVLEKDPDNVEALLGLAFAEEQHGNWESALHILNKLKKLSPDNPEVIFRLGAVHYYLEDYDKALEYYLISRLDEPAAKLSCCVGIAYCYFEKEHYGKAIEYIHKAYSLDPYDHQIGKLIAYIKEYIYVLSQRVQYNHAYILTKGLLEILPCDSEILAYMAYLEIAYKHNNESAENYLNKASNFSQTNNKDLICRIKGEIEFDFLGNQKEGIHFFEKAVAFNKSKINLLSLARRIKDVDLIRAQEICQELYKSNPKDLEVIYEFAQNTMIQGKWAEGIKLAQEGYVLEPSSCHICALLGYGYYYRKKFKESLQFYLMAQKFDHPDEICTHNAIAECYIEIGEITKAKESIIKAQDSIKKAQESIDKPATIDEDCAETKRILAQLEKYNENLKT